MASNKKKKLQEIWKRYEETGNPTPPTAVDVARWAVGEGLWRPKPTDMVAQCAEELARAAREEYRKDRYGRLYRARHCVREGQMYLWVDIDGAPRSTMEKAFAQRRKQIVGDCHQLRIDADHYNEIHPDEMPIQLVLNFEEDLLELEAYEKQKAS